LKQCTEAKGLKTNISKIKVMVSVKNCADVERIGKLQCGECGRCVRSNPVQCTECDGWIHERCSFVKDSLCPVAYVFVCKVYERAGGGEDINMHTRHRKVNWVEVVKRNWFRRL